MASNTRDHGRTGVKTPEDTYDVWTEFAGLEHPKSDKSDMVSSPPHYMLWGNTEARDLIRDVLTEEEWNGYCKGNFLKYRLRAGAKWDAEEDLQKSEVYRSWITEEYRP